MTTWRACSSRSSWADGAVLDAVLSRATYLGLLTSATFVRIGDVSEHAARHNDPRGLARALIERARPVDVRTYCAMGAESWEVSLELSPVVDGVLTGQSSLQFRFDGTSLDDPKRASAFMSAFRHAHRPEDTDLAFVHPEAHCDALARGAYHEPITKSVPFRGVHWANFLGTAPLEELDLDHLAALENVRFKWLGSRGAFFFSAPTPAAAAMIPEKQLGAWAKALRRAHRGERS